jgi:hypothetical protein
MYSEWKFGFDTSARVTCVIDADSIIRYCNPAWDHFALQNNARRATMDYVLGQPLFDYIPAILEAHYRKLVDTARLGREGAGSDYECHSLDKFRVYHLTVLPIPQTDLLAMVHSLRVERAMTFNALDGSAYHRGPGNVVTMCAQCRRAKNNHQQWNWVPDFVTTPPPRISHGICPDCTMYLHT